MAKRRADAPAAAASLSHRFLADQDARFANLIPSFVLALYSLIGGGLFYALHKDSPDVFEDRGSANSSSPFTHEKALYFATTVYTTIGYGKIQTCTSLGRAMTIIYAFVGIPLTLLSLDRLGKFLATVVNFAYRELVRIFKRRSKDCLSKVPFFGYRKWGAQDVEDGEEFSKETNRSEEAIPLLLALGLIFGWLLLMTGVWASIEDKWSTGEALYFVLVSVTTIGFGDIEQTKYQYTILYQFLLIIGLALFSMMINVIQQHLEILSDTLFVKIRETYKTRLLESDDKEEGTLNHKSAKLKVAQLAKESDTAFYRFFLSSETKERLAEELESTVAMRNARVQTEASYTHSSATQTKEEDLYRGQLQFARVQYLKETRQKVEGGAAAAGRPAWGSPAATEAAKKPSPARAKTSTASRASKSGRRKTTTSSSSASLGDPFVVVDGMEPEPQHQPQLPNSLANRFLDKLRGKTKPEATESEDISEPHKSSSENSVG